MSYPGLDTKKKRKQLHLHDPTSIRGNLAADVLKSTHKSQIKHSERLQTKNRVKLLLLPTSQSNGQEQTNQTLSRKQGMMAYKTESIYHSTNFGKF